MRFVLAAMSLALAAITFAQPPQPLANCPSCQQPQQRPGAVRYYYTPPLGVGGGPAVAAPVSAAPAPAPATGAGTPGTDYKVTTTPESVLEEVNVQRRAKGLPDYRYDAKLAEAAFGAALHRARNHIAGHCNDFSYLPAGTHADAAGCAAWRDGFGACAMFETQYHHAGAAFVVGTDGLKYCHLFVRR